MTTKIKAITLSGINETVKPVKPTIYRLPA
jgi:hypothetical protein